jgi:hypothetical protein
VRKKRVADPELVAYLARHPDVFENGSEWDKDVTVPCSCGAKRGRACKGLPSGTVHFGRRLNRLLQGVR